MSRIRQVMRELNELHRFQLRLQQRKRRQAERRQQAGASDRLAPHGPANVAENEPTGTDADQGTS